MCGNRVQAARNPRAGPSTRPELEAAETQLNAKEDELAQAQMDLGNDKEELERSKAAIDELMQIIKTLSETRDWIPS